MQTKLGGLTQACYDRMIECFKVIKAHDLDTTSSGAANCNDCGKSLNIWNKGNDALQRAFVMGLAMHTATDTFAHSAFSYELAGGSMGAGWKLINHASGNADDEDYKTKRVQMAYAVEKNVVSRYNGNRDGYHTCNDFYYTATGAYTNLDFRITKMRTFAEAAGYTTSSVLDDFGKLQSIVKSN